MPTEASPPSRHRVYGRHCRFAQGTARSGAPAEGTRARASVASAAAVLAYLDLVASSSSWYRLISAPPLSCWTSPAFR
jgi:hypothetical protein